MLSLSFRALVTCAAPLGRGTASVVVREVRSPTLTDTVLRLSASASPFLVTHRRCRNGLRCWDPGVKKVSDIGQLPDARARNN